MLYNFSFNPARYDLWGIYNVIKHFYPIGVSRIERDIYQTYPGLQELEKLLVDKILNDENFQRIWETFTYEIQNEIGKEVIGTTYGQTPSFSGSLIISKNKLGDCTHQKKLNFSVSLLGNFYQIYGLDETTIYNDEERRYFNSINVVTTSPFEEFKESFEFVERKLSIQFPKYKIVPFAFGQLHIKGLQVHYIDDEDCTLNQALFNDFLPEKVTYPTRGNDHYGIDKWKTGNLTDGGWSVY